MRSPRGFGKKYFTLASVLAHSIQSDIQSQIVKAAYFLKSISQKEDDCSEENDPPTELLTPLYISKKSPCHCNCLFRSTTNLKLKLHHFIPRCPYYTTYFAFRRSGVHPPSFIHK